MYFIHTRGTAEPRGGGRMPLFLRHIRIPTLVLGPRVTNPVKLLIKIAAKTT